MPGSSLWLVPPDGSTIRSTLTKLIEQTVPSLFPEKTAPAFAPHITLTSNIDPEVYAEKGPQKWLDEIRFLLFTFGVCEQWENDEEGVEIIFKNVRSEDVFFRRCYIAVEKNEELKELARIVRREAVLGAGTFEAKKSREGTDEESERWVREEYVPHASLMYADGEISEEKLKEVEKAVVDAGVKLRGEGEGLDGWRGGEIWLVPTDRVIEEWKLIAVVKL